MKDMNMDHNTKLLLKLNGLCVDLSLFLNDKILKLEQGKETLHPQYILGMSEIIKELAVIIVNNLENPPIDEPIMGD